MNAFALGVNLMELADLLTTERLKRRYKSENDKGDAPLEASNFDLVNYAISVAENMVWSDRDSSSPTAINNKAYQALDEIYRGTERFVEIRKREETPALQDPAKEAIVNKARAATPEPSGPAESASQAAAEA